MYDVLVVNMNSFHSICTCKILHTDFNEVLQKQLVTTHFTEQVEEPSIDWSVNLDTLLWSDHQRLELVDNTISQ